jgi:hypothetical protein
VGPALVKATQARAVDAARGVAAPGSAAFGGPALPPPGPARPAASPFGVPGGARDAGGGPAGTPSAGLSGPGPLGLYGQYGPPSGPYGPPGGPYGFSGGPYGYPGGPFGPPFGPFAPPGFPSGPGHASWTVPPQPPAFGGPPTAQHAPARPGNYGQPTPAPRERRPSAPAASQQPGPLRTVVDRVLAGWPAVAGALPPPADPRTAVRNLAREPRMPTGKATCLEHLVGPCTRPGCSYAHVDLATFLAELVARQRTAGV